VKRRPWLRAVLRRCEGGAGAVGDNERRSDAWRVLKCAAASFLQHSSSGWVCVLYTCIMIA
jgi:hypothetical protein